jgi:hypothetical protein
MQVVLPAPIRKDWREVSSAPTDTLGAKHWVKKNEAPFIAFPFEKKLWATSSAPQVSPEAKTALIKAIDTLLSSHPSLAALEPCRQITRSADTQDLLDKLDKMK